MCHDCQLNARSFLALAAATAVAQRHIHHNEAACLGKLLPFTVPDVEGGKNDTTALADQLTLLTLPQIGFTAGLLTESVNLMEYLVTQMAVAVLVAAQNGDTKFASIIARSFDQFEKDPTNQDEESIDFLYAVHAEALRQGVRRPTPGEIEMVMGGGAVTAPPSPPKPTLVS